VKPTRGADPAAEGNTVRVLLFTDTLGDINGVARFVRNVAREATAQHHDLTVFTSTRFDVPAEVNIRNFAPSMAMGMPGYAVLDLAVPPARAMLAAARELTPDVVHISTPGPVGLLGRWFARSVKRPTLGVYHTDFPAYVQRIFGDEVFTAATAWYMGWFYKDFHKIFLRSGGSAALLASLGLTPRKLAVLRAGIRVSEFQPSFADRAAMDRLCGGDIHYDRPLRVVYTGRISVEKNMAALARIWRRAYELLCASGIAAELVMVGDGPYRHAMEQALAGTRAVFLGFRHEQELAMCYASCDLFVFPSLTDTLGQVVMEAQSSGLPVLVSDSGGPRDVVRDGETGSVLALDTKADEQRWAEHIVEMLADPITRQRRSKAAHAWMSGWSFAASYESFWREHLLAAGGGSNHVRAARS